MSLGAGVLSGCAVLKKLKPTPVTQTLDAPGLAQVTRVVVVPAETRFATEQKRLLLGIERELKTAGCWTVVGHEEFLAQAGAKPIPRWFGRWRFRAREKPPGEMVAAVREQLPGADERLAVLVVWVGSWYGERYRKLNVIGDVASVFFGQMLDDIQKAKPETQFTYSRSVSARLIGSASGTLLWRMDSDWKRTENLDQHGLVPWAEEEEREAESEREFAGFRELIAGELVRERGCAAPGTAARP